MPNTNSFQRNSVVALLIGFQLISVCWVSIAFSYPVEFTDANGRKVRLEERPSRVVSLVPSITEIILKIGAADSEMMDLIALDNMATVVKMSLNALLNGLYYSMK